MELIQKKIRAFIADQFLFGQHDESLSDDDSLIERGVIDSTGVLQLIGFLEEEFRVKVGDDEVIPQNLDSINRLAEFVQRKWELHDQQAATEHTSERGEEPLNAPCSIET
jgi:acyl carrier protein